MSKDTGGPAFPFEGGDNNGMQPGYGMDLRDYFAAQVEVSEEVGVRYAEAIVGQAMPDFASDPLGNVKFWAAFKASIRYIEADAMLAARVKP